MRKMGKVSIAIFISVLCCVKASEFLNFQCTPYGERCIIPFSHEGIEYTQCAITGSVSWCPVSVNPTGTYNLSICTVCEAPSTCYARADEIHKYSWRISCPAGCGNVTARLWVSRKNPIQDLYSVDSFVCAAAIKGGKINGAVGGTVRVKRSGSTLRKVSSDGARDTTGVYTNFRSAPLFTIENSPDESPIIIFASVKEVEMLHEGSVKVLLKRQENAVSIVLNVRENVLYWGDVRERKIQRVNLSSSVGQVQTLSSLAVKIPDGIAIDWIHKLLYWTDAGYHSVSVSTEVGAYAKTLISRDTSYSPRAIALDPLRGLMYVTDWGNHAKIEQCAMDGDLCKIVVGNDISWPNGLTLDIENELMYWADARLHTISVATTEGLFRRELVSSAHLVKHPYSIVLHNDRLYWTDWNRGIVSVDKETGDDIHLHHVSSNKVMGLVIADDSLQPEYPSRCRRSSCKFLCLPNPKKSRCACPDGFVVSGGDDCTRLPHLSDQQNVFSVPPPQTAQIFDAKEVFEKEKHKHGRKGSEEL